MNVLVWPDEHDAHVDACYDADAQCAALCAWCRREVEKFEQAERRERIGHGGLWLVKR